MNQCQLEVLAKAAGIGRFAGTFHLIVSASNTPQRLLHLRESAKGEKEHCLELELWIQC